MRTIDRHSGFQAGQPDEISILTWNLTAPCYNEDLDWEVERLPSLQRWLERFAHCDVICVSPSFSTGHRPWRRRVEYKVGRWLLTNEIQEW
eukprot:CAMPEP_0171106692 /NCGR_PEP_ID=MMETSP0766_2-20121228/65296_1 /TAXON_ID=439317 /ORGANISM="Gambierdiscus australes, Strain CAWD 149" /LENGTH=90 /DNA_ID=CAMNT_0011567841 /DNA_START=68 /DNA_END=337 /DNA_ORIENTATION=-